MAIKVSAAPRFGVTRSGTLLSRLIGKYQLYRIYRLRPSHVGNRLAQIATVQDPQGLHQSRHPEIRAQHQYAGPDAYGFVYLESGDVIATCWYWTGRRYREQRNFWPLAEGEAKLVQIVTAESARGRGIAGRLLAHSAAEMAEKGFHTLYARVWHSNQPSIRAFERAGWDYIAFVADFYPPLRRQKPLRWIRHRAA